MPAAHRLGDDRQRRVDVAAQGDVDERDGAHRGAPVDTREAVRRHLCVDPASIAAAALDRPARTGAVPPETVAEAPARYGRES
ncbi:hypothetical protein GA0115245_135113 [Streptomyces sp. di188]|nr:hypothetical protein GA0115245_135113 [Streptomyces sp. di188]